MYCIYSHYKRKENQDGTFWKEGNFFCYSETSKAFRIYVPGEKHVEVSQDMTFHEEEAFKRSKELECDPEIDEAKAPKS